jgi:xylose isomerase
MNKLAIITAFLGGIGNRYMVYHDDHTLAEKLAMAGRVEGCDGVELCYPADFENLAELKSLLEQNQLGVAAINFRSRRTGKWWRGSFLSESAAELGGLLPGDDLLSAAMVGESDG